jgi:hypothetical protein
MGWLDFFKEDDEVIKQASSDKRLAPRWKVSVPARIKLEGFDSYLDCEIRDLNLKGFSLVISKKIIKKRLDAKLIFNEKYSFKIEVLVLWSRAENNKYIYGLKFNKILDADRGRILQMVKENFPPGVWKSL